MLGLAILFFFVSVFLLTLFVLSIMSKALKLYEERYATSGTRDLRDMFMFISPSQLVMITVAISVFLGFFGLLVGGIWLALLFLVFGFVSPYYAIQYLRKRRIERFNRQLVDALVQMSAALRAGLTLSQAAEAVAKEFDPPLGQEFGLFIKEVKLGITIEEALDNLADRVESEDLRLLVVATNVARKLGGNMAEMYEIIAGTIRERFRIEGKIKALTSQGKMQAIVVGAMPPLLGLVLYAMRPDLMGPFLESMFGKIVILIIAVMETVGILWIRKIVEVDF